jgi:hypothetical protein
VTGFEAEIRRQENLLYGVALFFEGISFLYAGQEAIITTYRKQLRNIIMMDRAAIDHAQALLEQAKRDPAKAATLRDFKFNPCQGHSHPAELCRRAGLLVESYAECFPGRPRSEPLGADDIVRLLAASAEKIDLRMP